MDKKAILIQILVFVIFVATCFGGGTLVNFICSDGFGKDSKWYQSLEQPSWNPPAWLFAPVWAVLYCLMATAAWLVWRETGFCKQPIPLAVFWTQIVFNFAWVFIFGMAHELGWAFAEIIVLWLLIVATMGLFFRVIKWTPLLLIPYLAWITFAACLNCSLWQLNKNNTNIVYD